MAQYFSPGVYIEEIETGPVPIQGVSTSITGAVGVTVKGPTSGKPILVTSFNDFQTTFGGFLTPPPQSQINQWLDPVNGGAWWQFPLSVKGYFDNGGQQLYVKRVFSIQNAVAAWGNLGQGLVAGVSSAAAATDSTIQLNHLFGIDSLNTGLQSITGQTTLQVVVNGQPITLSGSTTPQTFKVLWYDWSTRTVGLDQPLGQALKAGRDYVLIGTQNTPTLPVPSASVTLGFSASAKGDWGKYLAVQVSPVVGATLSILPDTLNGGPAFSGTIKSAGVMATFKVSIPQTGKAPVPTPPTTATGTVLINNNPYTPASVVAGNLADSTTNPATAMVPMTFTVTAPLSDGLQSLGSGLSVVIDPKGSNTTVTNASIERIATFQVTIPQTAKPALAVPTPTTVVITNITYNVSTVVAGSQADPTAHPPTEEVPMTFTVTAPLSDGLQSLGSGVSVVIDPTGSNVTVTNASIVSTPPPNTVTVNVSPPLPVGVSDVLIQGRIHPISGGATTAATSSFTINPAQLSWANWPPNTTIKSVRKARLSMASVANDTIDINDALQLYINALVELDNGTGKEYRTVVAINDVSVTVSTPLSAGYFEGQKVRVLEASVNVQQTDANGSVIVQESFSNLRLSVEADTSYLVNYINQFSKLVTVQAGSGMTPIFSDPSTFPTAPGGGWLALLHGDDALETLTVDDFVGADGGAGNRTGIQALEDIDDISICAVPGMWANTIQSALVTFCEQLADRFAILDPPDGLDVGGIQDFRAPFDSKYAALYYPWLNVRDPSLKQYVDLAPSAHMAGIYAQTDLARGVFKAPANVTVAGIYKFAADINQREQDVLNPIGINALRYFPNRGYRVWGARTLSSDTTWKYINVRRIFIYVEKSIKVGTQWVVFEPNDEGTWSRVRQTISDFLTTFWRQGGLQGTTAKDAFFVACDLGVTMSQDDIDNGRLIVQIGIAPVKPAEFVIFQIQQYVQDTQIS